VVLGLLPQATAPFGWIGLIAVWLLALLSGATVGQLLAEAVRPPEWDQARTPDASPVGHPNAPEASSHD
jgi:multicomponent Na+:H+ antiporter subunit G